MGDEDGEWGMGKWEDGISDPQKQHTYYGEDMGKKFAAMESTTVILKTRQIQHETICRRTQAR